MRPSDYFGQNWNSYLVVKFRNLLSTWKNNKRRLKDIFRPKSDISLLLHAVEHDPDFAADLIQRAIENDVHSSRLLGSVDGNSPLYAAIVKRNYQLVEMILKYATDQGRCVSLFDSNALTRTHGTPFQLAIRVQDTRLMSIIFKFGLENGIKAVKLLGLKKGKQKALHYAIDKSSCHEVLREIVTLAMTNVTICPSQSHCTAVEMIMRFALEIGVDWRTLIDIKDTDLRFKLKRLFYKQIVCEPRIWPRLYPSQPSVVLSAPTRSRTNERSNLSPLPDEVLVIIFEYLDGLDLSNCELVCHRWRNILSRKIIWSKLHSRKSKQCKTYRKIQRIVELDDGQFVHCGSKEKCKMISRKLQELDHNWRTGNYQMKIGSWYNPYHLRFKNDDNYLVCHRKPNRFSIINRQPIKNDEANDRVRELDSRFNDVSDFQIHGNNIVVASDEFIRVFNATTLREVNEVVVPNNWKIVNLCFEHGLLVALSESSRDLPKRRQLTVWRVDSATDIQHLVDLAIAGDEDQKRTTNVAMDRRYIAVFLETQQSTKIYFVCTETWTILERSPTITAAYGRILHYHPGLLITKKNSCIGLKDLFTGDCREIHLYPLGLSSALGRTQIRANSKYLVVMNGQAHRTKVGIFRITSECDTPLCCFDIPMAVKWFEMDETELICTGWMIFVNPHIVVIDFLPTPPNREIRRTASSGSLLNDDPIEWRFPLAKEINETLISFKGNLSDEDFEF